MRESGAAELLEIAKEKNNEESAKSEGGCTATCVLLTPDKIICVNAGDSRTIVSRNKGEHEDLSSDHKPENDLETQRIEAAGGYVQ